MKEKDELIQKNLELFYSIRLLCFVTLLYLLLIYIIHMMLLLYVILCIVF